MSAYLPWIGVLFALETVSALTIFHPFAHGVALLVACLGMMVLAWRRPATAASLLLMEYVIGSKGALLRFGGDGVGHGGVPLRIGWFIAFFLGWSVWAMQTKTYRAWRSYLKERTVYLVLAGVLIYAFVLGLVFKNPFVLADANGWGVWLLLLPALDLAVHKKDELTREVPRAMLVAFLWTVMKTLILFYLFAHLTNPAWLEAIYLWIRRTGVGEVTRALPQTNIWRVFFQSHIYLLPVIVGSVWYTWMHTRLPRLGWVLMVGAGATAVISLSRSLFLGIAGGALISLIWIGGACYRAKFFEASGRIEVIPGVKRIVLAFVGALLLVAALFYAPPRPAGSLRDALLARVNVGEEAAVSRWKLLPALWEGVKRRPIMGSGFGATITYQSHDPRVVKATGGSYTTYAFEWGWLEHWFKFGIVGIPLLVWILVRLGKLAWTSRHPVWMRGALVASLAGLAITHVFTPYLNHPLGMMWLMALEALLALDRATLPA